MASDMTSRRVPWVALALSFLSPGVGHIYCGRIAKGLPLYFAWLLVPLCAVLAALVPPSVTVLMLLLLLPAVAVLLVYLYAAIDAWRLASQIGSDYSLRDYNHAGVYWLLIVVQLIYSIGLIVGMRGFVYEAYLIPASSMSPTILNGDRILARKLLPANYFPERGDLIVFRNPTPSIADAFVKRVVAVAGDHIEIRGERLLINGKELERDRVPDEILKFLGKQLSGRVEFEVNSGHRYLVAYGDYSEGGRAEGDFDATIPERHVFVLGDNRDRSNDSRHFGSIPVGDIVGYVDYIYWPSESWSRFGVLNDRLP
ncbi:signal peptidase I [Bythopirellula goksoeyrii]|uniref:Signal peptidase I n=1 Tax=Bythopirellula goksoeyrii TaxID=1400387 RepID=A0A5B9QFE4_9BACT|nr:signal peptidase I [Bythopirellula goksoeyrii]QEG37614.1 Signal peptidase I [Bythopirellula goksoeyrii]